MSPVISVEKLSKKYLISHQREESYTNLRDVLASGAHRLVNKLRHPFSPPENDPAHETFWALDDVSFDVRQGERVGIIGRNGAGKSTLLKILSRITDPTNGLVRIRGRVASLLEVGTGFHPELTGRENIFLNGAILGMSNGDIKKRFDEIVAFSEVERFLDTPVKRYSSGMYVRLAFAVAAHLEPEVLIVDEVLAVGDARFQKKCMGKMKEVGNEGRTVLFVSHTLTTIQTLCERSILLSAGKVVKDGETGEVIETYLSTDSSELSSGLALKSLGDLDIRSVILKDKDNRPVNLFHYDQPLTIEIHYEAHREIDSPYFWMSVRGANGGLFAANMLLDGKRPSKLSGGGILSCTFPNLRLIPGYYSISMGVRDKFGNSVLVETGVVGNFEVTAEPGEMGFASEVLDKFLPQTSGVLLPYEWHLPDGSIHKVAATSQS